MNAPLLHLVLAGEKPMSLNAYYAGQHFAARRAEVARVRSVVRSVLDPATVRLITRPVVVVIVAYFHDHIMDADNVLAKCYLDSLKDWVLPDDDPVHVRGVYTAARMDKAHPRVELFFFDAALPIPNLEEVV